jgi:hypothetical protein
VESLGGAGVWFLCRRLIIVTQSENPKTE